MGLDNRDPPGEIARVGGHRRQPVLNMTTAWPGSLSLQCLRATQQLVLYLAKSARLQPRGQCSLEWWRDLWYLWSHSDSKTSKKVEWLDFGACLISSLPWAIFNYLLFVHVCQIQASDCSDWIELVHTWYLPAVSNGQSWSEISMKGMSQIDVLSWVPDVSD